MVSKAVPSVSPERLPLSLSFPPACQQQVVGSAEALCGASLAKCIGLIALLHMHPLPSIKANYLWHIHPPDAETAWCKLQSILKGGISAKYAFPSLEHPVHPKHSPNCKATPLQAAEPMASTTHGTGVECCGAGEKIHQNCKKVWKSGFQFCPQLWFLLMQNVSHTWTTEYTMTHVVLRK